MNIVKSLVPTEKYNIKCPYSMTPTRIVVHNTYNDASAKNEIAYMIRNNNKVSFHYAVDDVEAVQGIPENRNSWNAGDGSKGKGNREGIAIEICYSKSGGDRFIKAEKNAVKLIVDILKRYNWGIDKVTKHQDYSGKYCPHRTLDMGWDRFIKMIEAELKPIEKPVNTTKNDSFLPARGYFTKGDKGENVKKINDFYYRVFPSYAKTLNRNKENVKGDLFGDNSVAWTKEFQKRTGLKVDGYFGKITLAELKKYGFKE